MRKVVAFAALAVGVLLAAGVGAASGEAPVLRLVERRPGVWIGMGRVSDHGPPGVGVVDVRVHPRRAHVTLDGRKVGLGRQLDGSPSYLFLRPGSYEVAFELGGYRTASVVAEIESGRHYEIRGRLERVPEEKVEQWWHQEPEEDIQRVFAPVERQAPARTTGADVGLRPDLAAPASEQGGTSAVALSVQPLHAAVYIDGRFVGVARDLMQRSKPLALEPGDRLIEAVAPGYNVQRRSVELSSGEVLKIDLELARQHHN